MTAAAFVTSGTNYPVLDGILGISLIVHSHIGVRLVSNFNENRLLEPSYRLRSWLERSANRY